VVLMHDHDGRCTVNYHPAFCPRFVDHPIVPAYATDRKVGNIKVRRKRKEEEVGACAAVIRSGLAPVFADLAGFCPLRMVSFDAI